MIRRNETVKRLGENLRGPAGTGVWAPGGEVVLEQDGDADLEEDSDHQYDVAEEEQHKFLPRRPPPSTSQAALLTAAALPSIAADQYPISFNSHHNYPLHPAANTCCTAYHSNTSRRAPRRRFSTEDGGRAVGRTVVARWASARIVRALLALTR